MNNTLEKKMDRLSDNLGNLSKKVDHLASGLENLTATVDNLAIAVKNGFDDVKKDLKDEFNPRFDKIEYRLDRIENISLGNHERRIETLEDKVLVINKKIGLKK